MKGKRCLAKTLHTATVFCSLSFNNKLSITESGPAFIVLEEFDQAVDVLFVELVDEIFWYLTPAIVPAMKRFSYRNKNSELSETKK